jgi:hypothetical protein
MKIIQNTLTTLSAILANQATESTLEQLKNGLRGNVIQDIAILAHQTVTHPATVKGTAQDVSTVLKATIILFHASIEAAANTNPGKFLIQISGSAQGNEDWATIFEFDATISTADTESLTATEPVGETALAVVATAGFIANDILYIQDASVVVDGEWARCREIVTDSTIDLVDGLTKAKDSSDVLWNDADIFTCALDLEAVSRIRVVFQHEGASGVNCHVKGLMVTGDHSG